MYSISAILTLNYILMLLLYLLTVILSTYLRKYQIETWYILILRQFFNIDNIIFLPLLYICNLKTRTTFKLYLPFWIWTSVSMIINTIYLMSLCLILWQWLNYPFSLICIIKIIF